jgi:hypothetical protein
VTVAVFVVLDEGVLRIEDVEDQVQLTASVVASVSPEDIGFFDGRRRLTAAGGVAELPPAVV